MNTICKTKIYAFGLTTMLLFTACSSAEPTPVAKPQVTIVAQPTVAATAMIVAPPASTAPVSAPTASSVPPTSGPASTVAANSPPQLTVTNDFVNVRSGPATGYNLLGKLDKGQQAVVTGRSTDGQWWQIQFNGNRGWVIGQFVSANPAASNTAVAEAPLLPTQPPIPTSPPAQVIDLQPAQPTITPVPFALAPTAPPAPVGDGCNENDPNWRGKGQASYQFCVRQDLEWANGDNKSQQIELYWDVYGVQSVELRIEGDGRGGRRVPVSNAGRFGINKAEYSGCFKAELYITRKDGQIAGYNEKTFCA